MVKFPFDVNKSFLEKGWITIKRECNEELEGEGFHEEENIRVVFPSGRTELGYVYSGTSSWGPYHQLKLYGRPSTLPVEEFEIGHRIAVAFLREHGNTVVKLSIIADLRELDKLLKTVMAPGIE